MSTGKISGKMYDSPRMLTAGEHGLVVEFGDGISPEINACVISLAGVLAAGRFEGILELVPTYRSLMIFFDPLRVDRNSLIARIEELPGFPGATRRAGKRGRNIRVPVCYGGEFGPDLDFVADYHGITPEQVVRTHCAGTYRVYMLGFMPGFAYLGGVPESIASPRLEKPRRKVVSGSVGIAGGQTGIYPLDSPGGWRIIGRTPLRLFAPGSSRPFLIAAGDSVQFEPITVEQFHLLKGEIDSGSRGTEDASSGDAATGTVMVMKPGLLTTVQDEGRYGYRAYGMPVSGAMDRYAYRIANILAGNGPCAAALEMTLLGGVFRFRTDAYVSVCGADMRGKLNGVDIRNWSGFPVTAGSELSFGHALCGCRSYLAIHGGISVPSVMGSRSTCLRAGIGGFRGRALLAGDVVTCGETGEHPAGKRILPRRFVPGYPESIVLRVLPGPQDDLFTEEGLSVFFSSGYRVSPRNDRMGYLLEGPRVRHKDGADIVSDALCMGAVQVPGSGMPIVMTADHQTSGGYAKIGAVIGSDLTKLCQSRQGNRIRFVRCTDGEAVAALKREREIYERIQAEFPET